VFYRHDAATAARDEALRKVDVCTQALRRDKERPSKGVADLKSQAGSTRLGPSASVSGRREDSADDGGSATTRCWMSSKTRRDYVFKKGARPRGRELRSALRQGIWHDKRKEMHVGPDDHTTMSPRFTDLDLVGNSNISRPKM
jgi:hypothetical protein